MATTAESRRRLLQEVALRHHIVLSEKQLEQFSSYLTLIQRWQRTVVRLVGKDDSPTLIEAHVADAFCIYRSMNRWNGMKLIDIGSGAGFPGVCLKIIEPGLHVTLLDASAKKTSFLAKATTDLGLEGVEVVRGRAEQLAHEAGFREQFGLATMRAVVNLARGIEIGLPFVRVWGHLIVARGTVSRRDAETVARVGPVMGGGEFVVRAGLLGDFPVRGSIIVLGKVNRTERCYPRARGRAAGRW